MSDFTRADLDELCSIVEGGPVVLTDEQFAAISAPASGPVVVEAGAGSGKTFVMALRVVWLVATGVIEPSQALGLTFSRMAAGELASRISAYLEALASGTEAPEGTAPGEEPEEGASPDGAEPADGEKILGDPVVQTYHSFAASVLGEYGLRAGIEPASRVIDEPESVQIALAVVRETEHLDGLELSAGPATITKRVLDLDSALADADLAPAQLRGYAEGAIAQIDRAIDGLAPTRTVTHRKALIEARTKMLERIGYSLVVEELRAVRQAAGLATFADLTRACAELMAGPAGATVADMLRQRFPVVLLDEYQDTSTAQARTLQSMFGRGHALTAVGDAQQLIYQWRGASVGNLGRFPAMFGLPDGDDFAVERTTLTLNRRSGAEILDAANRIVDGMPESSQGVRLVPADGAKPALVEAEIFELERDELAHLVRRIAQNLDAGVPASQIAVLLRRSKEFEQVERALLDAGIKARRVGRVELGSAPVIAELVNQLWVIDDPAANAETLRVLIGPRYCIGPGDLVLITDYAKALARHRGIVVPDSASGRRVAADEAAEEEWDAAGHAGESGGSDAVTESLREAVAHVESAEVHSISEAVLDLAERSRGGGASDALAPQAARVLAALSPEAVARCQQFGDELDDLREHLSEPLTDLVERVVATIGLRAEARLQATGAEESLEYLGAFGDVVSQFTSATHAPSLTDLLAWLVTADDADQGISLVVPPPPPDTVRLMTVHSAKGLEFDVVVVPFLADGVFPGGLRGTWLSDATDIPGPLVEGSTEANPQWSDSTFKDAAQEAARQRLAAEERRLAYVAMTRARRGLYLSAHLWPLEGSARKGWPFVDGVVTERPEHWPEALDTKSGARELNPHGELTAGDGEESPTPWPAVPDARSARVTEMAGRVRAVEDPAAAIAAADRDLTSDEQALFAALDVDVEALLDEAREAAQEAVIEVDMPQRLWVSAISRLRQDPDGFALSIRRPMPSRPSPAARRGTAFHEWVEHRFDQQPLVVDLPAAGDQDWPDPVRPEELDALKAKFEASEFADRRPYAVEEPVSLVLAGVPVVGRIDAVYRLDGVDPASVPDAGPDDGTEAGPDAGTEAGTDAGTEFLWEVVDWKTGGQAGADPVQLAVYRLAWARRMGVDPSRVSVAFFHVADGEVRRFSADELLDEAGLTELFTIT